MADKPKREQVKDLIAEGGLTKMEVANKLGMSPASVSSQMTYLRWMGNNFIYDEDKVLSIVSDEDFAAWQELQKANKKTKKPAVVKSPAQQAKAAAKTFKVLSTSLVNWEEKLEKTTADDIDDYAEFELEANANITLLKIKIKRAKIRVEETAQILAEAPDEETDVIEDPEDADNELL